MFLYQMFLSTKVTHNSNAKMATFVVIWCFLTILVHIIQCQVSLFQNLDAHEERISILESSIVNATSCCSALKKENEFLKLQHQQLMSMVQNLSIQVSALQQNAVAMSTVSTTVTTATQTPPTPSSAISSTTAIRTPPAPPTQRDCADLAAKGETSSGVYEIELGGSAKQVYCDLYHDGGRWTVIQRRQDGSVNFNRNWTDYREGFGNLTSEFWLGNEAIHRLTAAGNNVINIKLMDWTGDIVYAEYRDFYVGPESMDYTLTAGKYTGTAGDSFNYPQSSLLRHNNHRFSTPDRDRDSSFMNCAKLLNSGWWFNSCYSSNLNGVFLKGIPYGPKTMGEISGDPTLEGTGIEWYPWKQKQYSMARVEMKIRPA
ncbi:fibrinogen-like protein 1 [Saccostrea echinata]|uniref:fibrinogen-like protein 1 n=1 Tax=Saccostrea echinata TaxID=191078 RepID=UPI002A83ABD4|nr:fibrinogen-like protein 1 [Saccostrea echinata]